MSGLRFGGGECDGYTLRSTSSRVQRAVRPNGTRNDCTDLLSVPLRELCVPTLARMMRVPSIASQAQTTR
eukprot:15456731-Alexandrium_andersonii.AAC.1